MSLMKQRTYSIHDYSHVAEFRFKINTRNNTVTYSNTTRAASKFKRRAVEREMFTSNEVRCPACFIIRPKNVACDTCAIR